MTSLAVPSDLSTFLQETFDAEDTLTATLLLDIASGMVRDHLKIGDLNAVAADVVELDPINGVVFLPSLPVTAVSLVETFDGTAWSTAAASTYRVSKRLGIIFGLPGLGVRWPAGPETWRVTYDHGFTVIPSTIKGVVLGVAARERSTPTGLAAETFGPHSVRYQMQADGFTDIERKALANYVNPNIA